MHGSKFKKVVYTFAACCVFVVGYMILPTISEQIYTFVSSSPESTLTKSIVQEVKKEFFSTPLRSTFVDKQGTLTSKGVITTTNLERGKENLSPLLMNEQLTHAAQLKLDDMFAQQYFEHMSPQGNGPGYLAEQSEYSYIIVGENLALGNFADDKDLVAAWMASPGHRANIMHERFTEIGVAVGIGMFNGKRTWLAVQEFGTPASSCPSLDQNLKQKIDDGKASILMLSDDIEKLRIIINTMPRESREEQQAYNKKISEYNDLIVEYESWAAQVGVLIEQYNTDVRVYNACIKGN